MKRLSELMEQSDYVLYCDMDGVLCDFDERFFSLFKKQPAEIEGDPNKGPAYFWAMIHRVGKKYWSDMKPTPHGLELWAEISKYNPSLLTAPPKKKGDMTQLDPVTMEGKREWAEKYLSPSPSEIIFKRSKDKQLIAQRDVALGLKPILIDDRQSNIKEWEAAGGIALYHPKNGDPSGVIKALKGFYESSEEGI